MSASAPHLLATKHQVPPLRPGVVPRERLIGCLEHRGGERIVLVSAPPGFGKTTLLGWWAATSPTPVAWLSLDAGDADPVRLVRYLVAAVETASPGSVPITVELLRAPIAVDVERVLAVLVNELSDRPGRLSLILDDYHLVESDDAHRAVAFLGEHLPARLGLVIATRVDPPLPVASWRARGILGELRATDLRFSIAEAARFLRDTMGFDLGEGEVAALRARTEGWPAGLHLAALSLRRHADRDGFIRDLAGDDRFILDYLIGDVLARLPGERQDFLLLTSILDRLSGPLCDAVTGGRDGAAVLEDLDRSNAFVEALGSDGRWYRSHRLFTDLLRHRLHVQHPGVEPELHRRAAEWYESQGMVTDAIPHAMASGDVARAARLVESAAVPALAAGELGTVLAWVESLGDHVLQNPLLCALGAMTRFYRGRPVESLLPWLEAAEAPDAPDVARGTAATLRALMAALAGEGGRARGHAARALELLPPDRGFLRVLAGTASGLAALGEGDVDAADRAFEGAAHAAANAGHTLLQTLAMRRLAAIAAMRGDLHVAEARYRRLVEETGDAPGAERSPFAGLGWVGLGGIARERGDLDGAESMVRQGVDLLAMLGPPFVIEGAVTLGRVLCSRGDLRGAAAAMEEAARLARAFDATTDDDAFVAAMAARVHLAEGDVAGAARWAEALPPTPAADGPARRFYPGEAEAGSLARLLVAMGRPEEAVAVLTPWIDRADAQRRHGSVIELEIVRAIALDRCGDEQGARSRLDRALRLAAPHGHIQAFLDEGELLVGLLRRTVASGVGSPHGRVVLAAAGTAGEAGVTAPDGTLTEAERRILGRLSSHLTSVEIAREFFVAPSTVRTHIKAIYRKLGVQRRRDAVERARRLGLL